MDYLQSLDSAALLAVNGTHDAFQNDFWWALSSPLSWLLIGVTAIVVLVLALRGGSRTRLLLAVLAIGLTVLIADQSAGIIKDIVCRYRPTHSPDIAQAVQVVNDYRGGNYGFVSNHAANAFGIALLISLMFRNRHLAIAMTAWALVQCYSRAYLGVHYPGDLLGGMLVGLLAGGIAYWLWTKADRKWGGADGLVKSPRGAMAIASSVWLTLIGIALYVTIIS